MSLGLDFGAEGNLTFFKNPTWFHSEFLYKEAHLQKISNCSAPRTAHRAINRPDFPPAQAPEYYMRNIHILCEKRNMHSSH